MPEPPAVAADGAGSVDRMKAQAFILSVMLLAGLTGTLVWLAVRRSAEPVYAGKPVTFWVDRGYGPAATQEQLRRADAAVRAAGTKALPFWVTLLGGTNDSRFRQEFNADFRRFPSFHLATADERRHLALCAFHSLGADGKPAIPSLSKLLGDFRTCPAATIVLAGLGPEGLAAITNALANRNNPWRFWIAATLGSWNGKPPNFQWNGSGPWEWPPPVMGVIIPVLVNCLQDDNLNLRVFSAQSLGCLAREPARVVPALTDLLARDTNGITRLTTIVALGKFGLAARAARSEINRHLHDPDAQLRVQATKALEQIDSAASSGVGAKS